MKLFKYEMKKLIINKNRLILLAVLFAFYIAVGFMFGEADSASFGKGSAYNVLAKEKAGTLDLQQLAQSTAMIEEAIREYGEGELNTAINRNPVLQFHFEYVNFGQDVDTYWNGRSSQNPSEITGIYPLQEKIAEMKADGQTDTFAYRKLTEQLKTETALGVPVYENAMFWNNFSVMNEGIFIMLFLLMPLCYFISPLFTQEVKTGMDSIVLCTQNGRREIVTAKLLSAGLTSAAIVFTYVFGYFIGTFLGYQDLSGFDAPVRCLRAFETITLDTTVLGMALTGALWLIFAGIVFGLTLALISSFMKNQSAAMGIGLVIIVGSAMSENIPPWLRQPLWPVMDFNFAALANVTRIFSGDKVYNIFENPVSYAVAALSVGILLCVTVCLLTYIRQKKRSAV